MFNQPNESLRNFQKVLLFFDVFATCFKCSKEMAALKAIKERVRCTNEMSETCISQKLGRMK